VYFPDLIESLKVHYDCIIRRHLLVGTVNTVTTCILKIEGLQECIHMRQQPTKESIQQILV